MRPRWGRDPEAACGARRAFARGTATWISQNFIQLVLLPALMVGQNLQNEAADVRAAKTFEDTELIVDRLDVHTEGGLKTILDRLEVLEAAMKTDLPRR